MCLLVDEGGDERRRYEEAVEKVLGEGERPDLLPVSLAYDGRKPRRKTPATTNDEEEDADEEGPSSVLVMRGRTGKEKTSEEDDVGGSRRKRKKKKKATAAADGRRRMFDNQMTLLLENRGGESLNMKVFGNGRVQITGAKTVDMARDAITDVRRILFAMPVDRPSVVVSGNEEDEVPSYASAVARDSFRVCLINSDARLPHGVRRSALYKAMVTEEHMFCSYEPCTYPGVKMVFLCDGEGKCRRGDTPSSEKEEVRIRCVVFRSGCVLLTGALTYAHLNGSYGFITRLLRRHEAQIRSERPT